MFRYLGIALAATPLAACQSFSFASPAVTTDVQVAHYDELACKAVPKRASGQAVEIQPTMIGATTLIHNFVLAYRCAEQDLANGRQYFEVPAFLSAAAGLIGPTAFGFTERDVLKLGAAGAILNAGNSYYAPKAKAAILSSALRAILCVKTESVGISYFRHKEEETPESEDRDEHIRDVEDQIARLQAEASTLMRTHGIAPNTETAAALAENARQRGELIKALTFALTVRSKRRADDEVFLDAERQYFEMVAGSLFTIESILSERLRDAGSPDMTQIFDRLKELAKEEEQTEQALRDEERKAGGPAASANLQDEVKKSLIKLENSALQPKLQVCVLQARV